MDTQAKVPCGNIWLNRSQAHAHAQTRCATKTHTTASIQTVTVFYYHFESYNWVAEMAREGTESIELSEVSFMQVAGHVVEVSAATTDANQAKMGTTPW